MNVCTVCRKRAYLVTLHDGTEAYVTHDGRLSCRPFTTHGPGKRKRKR